jgi:hypothetical protein
MTAFLAQLQSLVQWIGGHSTKILGFLTVTVSYLRAEQVISDAWLPRITIVLGLFTVWRGFFTGAAYNRGVADTYAGTPEVQAKIVNALAFTPPAKNASAVNHLMGSSGPPQTPSEPK